MILPSLQQGQASARRISCVNQLRQIGLAFHNFALDHNQRFPMQTPLAEGGSMELVESSFRVHGDFYFSCRHFLAASNELATPRILRCPSDTRESATSFSSFNNSNLSYFVGINAQASQPAAILAGDRNVTSRRLDARGTLLPLAPLQWTEELHRLKGNLLFADGHVERCGREFFEESAARLSGFGFAALPSLKLTAEVQVKTAIPELPPRPPEVTRTNRVFVTNQAAATPPPAQTAVVSTAVSEHFQGDLTPVIVLFILLLLAVLAAHWLKRRQRARLRRRLLRSTRW